MSDDIVKIEVEGLEPVVERFKHAPRTLANSIKKGLEASLDVVHESVPGYPPQRPTPYIRTGTLGRSLGVTVSGSKTTPSGDHIRQVKGAQAYFGTRLKYAPYVVGDASQAKVHRGWWWTLKDVAARAADKVQKVWDKLIQKALDT